MPTGTSAPNIMDYDYSVEYSQTWSGGLQYELLPSTMVEVVLHGHVDARRRQRDRPQRAGAGRRARFRRAGRFRSLSRINAIRFDGKSIYHGAHAQGRAAAASRLSPTTSATRCRRRKTMPRARARPKSETNVPQNVRNIFDETGEWARSSFDHRHQFVASGIYQLPFFQRRRRPAGRRARRLARQRRLHRAVRRAVHGEPGRRSGQHRRRSGAASRSAARSESAGGRADARALVRHVGVRAAGAVHVRQRAAQQRDRSRASRTSISSWPRRGASAARASSSSAGRSSTLLNRRTSTCRTASSAPPNFGRIFSAKNPREMQFGAKLSF